MSINHESRQGWLKNTFEIGTRAGVVGVVLGALINSGSLISVSIGLLVGSYFGSRLSGRYNGSAEETSLPDEVVTFISKADALR